MIDFLVTKIHDAHFITMMLAAIAASATAYTLIMPIFAGEGLAKRMKAVASERERIRQRERERLTKTEKVSLRQTPKQLVSKVVEDFNLGKWLAQEAAREKLIMAGYRGHAPYVTFLFFRLVTPILLFVSAVLYVFVIAHMEKSLPVKVGMCIGAAYLGLQAPMLFLKNAISKRQLSIKRAFPDALDLLLICIESGMSIETAFRKVSTEIVSQSVALSEEFTLTTAELSYLQDRKVAYENLAKRTGLEGVKSVCLALQQSERYGTPLGQSLRVMAQENRDMRMNEAEKKAAALPPKLTVPMIFSSCRCCSSSSWGRPASRSPTCNELRGGAVVGRTVLNRDRRRRTGESLWLRIIRLRRACGLDWDFAVLQPAVSSEAIGTFPAPGRGVSLRFSICFR